MEVAEKAVAEIRKVTEELTKDPNILLSYSGGKDSIVLLDIFKRAYRGDWSKVTVVFIDEEAIFSGVVESTMRAKKMVEDLGGTFEWYCLPFLHFSAISSLKEDGVYMLWQESEKDKWVRNKPDFAITYHPDFQAGMSYQEFFNKKMIPKYDLCLQGVRIHESLQRRQTVIGMKYSHYGLSASGVYYPIRHMTEKDIWEYINFYKLDFPIEYLYIHQMKAVNRKVTASSQLRMSQLFSSDTIGTLVYLKEFDPELWKRIRIRQPNAYLASLYYGTSFSKDNEFKEDADYFQLVIDFWNAKSADKKPGNAIKRKLALCIKKGARESREFQRLMYSYYRVANGKGDPKGRALRAFGVNLTEYVNQLKDKGV